MSEPCPCCGAERPDRVDRFGLTVQRDPNAVFWKGIRYDLPRGHVRTLYLLVQRGQASHMALEMLTVGEDAITDVVRVRICHLRAWLRRLDNGPTIRTERGWGYVLEDAAS